MSTHALAKALLVLSISCFCGSISFAATPPPPSGGTTPTVGGTTGSTGSDIGNIRSGGTLPPPVGPPSGGTLPPPAPLSGPTGTGPTQSTTILHKVNSNIQTPTIGIMTTDVPGGDYSKFPSCPGDPSNSAQATKSPICPDLNGNYAPGHSEADKNCPDQCTVTTSVNKSSKTTNHQVCAGTGAGSICINIPVTTTDFDVKPGVCPAGYITATTFKVSDEYAYSDSTVTVNPQNMTEMTNYTNNGYICQGGTYSNIYKTPCVSGVGDNNRKWNNGAILNGETGWGNDNNNYGGNMPNEPNKVVVMYYGFPSCYTAGALCGRKLDTPIDCGVSGSYFWTYDYQQISCTRPPGVYPTGYKIPASQLCILVKSQWQKIN